MTKKFIALNDFYFLSFVSFTHKYKVIYYFKIGNHINGYTTMSTLTFIGKGKHFAFKTPS